MWLDEGSLVLSILVSLFVATRGSSFRPKNCALLCVHQGVRGCEFCRISKEDVQTALGFASAGVFSGCVPWPCHAFLGVHTPEVCQHYVQAPQNVTIEFVESQNPEYDTIVVSWSPSPYGIAFLRGFQVSLHALGGSKIACQLFLLQNNMSLSAVHAQMVYFSDQFTNLSLGSKYAVAVMALPVPEKWDKFYHSTMFFTRTCPEKNGLERCKKDWYPRHIEVHQESQDIIVTFNLAPENLGINCYFYACYGGGMQHYEIIQPDTTLNRTHHTFRLVNFHKETNYTCEIAADLVDAVRKTFFVEVQQNLKEPLESNSLAVLLSVGILLAVFIAVIFAMLWKKRLKKKAPKIEIPPVLIDENDKYMDGRHSIILSNSTRPPQLLMCYSSKDGPVHVRVVLQLATFVQKHMATQVHLDLWDTLNIMQEGDLGWYCRRIKESDYVMVICSKGLNHREEEEEPLINPSLAIIAMIGEEIFQAKALGQDLSKYITAIFEYSKKSDIPTMLSLASNYTLPKDFPLLFSHLHRIALQKPGACLLVENISENDYFKLPAGAALQLAVKDAKLI